MTCHPAKVRRRDLWVWSDFQDSSTYLDDDILFHKLWMDLNTGWTLYYLQSWCPLFEDIRHRRHNECFPFWNFRFVHRLRRSIVRTRAIRTWNWVYCQCDHVWITEKGHILHKIATLKLLWNNLFVLAKKRPKDVVKLLLDNTDNKTINLNAGKFLRFCTICRFWVSVQVLFLNI